MTITERSPGPDVIVADERARFVGEVTNAAVRRRFRSPLTLRYLLGRVLGGVFAIWAVITVTFIALNVTGNPLSLFVPADSPISLYRQTAAILGLNKPMVTRYFTFLYHAIIGKFPNSLEYREPSFHLVLQHLPATLLLGGTALGLSVLMGLVIGYVSAVGKHAVTRNVPMGLSMTLHAFPSFILGIFLVMAFGVWLHWLPTSGSGGVEHLVLPAVTLSMLGATPIARVFRTSLINTLGDDHVRTAQAKGLSPSAVRLRHVVMNSILPVLTVIGLQSGLLLGGTVIVEQVFAWPGVGQLAIQAVMQHDYPLVLADTTVIAIGFVVANLIVDILYGLIDPRARQS